MSATDELYDRLGTGYPYTLRPELHKALKARGVDYWVAQGLTFWNCSDGRECVAYGYQSNGKPRLAVKIVGITYPEQAVEATLGRKKCKNVHEPPKDTTFWPAPHFKCSVCGKAHVSTDYVYFCPNCGAEVDEVGDERNDV